jgi:hypothetical protein
LIEAGVILAVVMFLIAIRTSGFILSGIVGCAFCVVGVSNLIGIHRSRHVFASGVIYGLTQS